MAATEPQHPILPSSHERPSSLLAEDIPQPLPQVTLPWGHPWLVIVLLVALTVGIAGQVLRPAHQQASSAASMLAQLQHFKQDQGLALIPQPSQRSSQAEAQLSPAMAALPTQQPPMASATGPKKTLRTGLNLNYGHSDPLEPLVQLAAPAFEDPAAVDPLAGVHFVGVIAGQRKDKPISLIEVVDPASNNSKTLVKAIGEMFTSNGNTIRILKVSPNQLEVSVNGEPRLLPLTMSVKSTQDTQNSPNGAGALMDTLAE